MLAPFALPHPTQTPKIAKNATPQGGEGESAMSSYIQKTRNPYTGQWEMATWHDNYFGPHHYGVEFNDGQIVDPNKTELEIKREYGELKTRNP